MLLGLSARQIATLVEQKVLKHVARGTFDAAHAVQSYVAHREKILAERAGRGAFGMARADLYQERAQLARLQRLEREGELVPADEVERVWLAAAGIMRGKLLSIPAKVAARLAVVQSAAEAQAIVRDEIHEVLREISNIKVRNEAA